MKGTVLVVEIKNPALSDNALATWQPWTLNLAVQL